MDRFHRLCTDTRPSVSRPSKKQINIWKRIDFGVLRRPPSYQHLLVTITRIAIIVRTIIFLVRVLT